jgi:hypothetical protein
MSDRDVPRLTRSFDIAIQAIKDLRQDVQKINQQKTNQKVDLLQVELSDFGEK